MLRVCQIMVLELGRGCYKRKDARIGCGLFGWIARISHLIRGKFTRGQNFKRELMHFQSWR